MKCELCGLGYEGHHACVGTVAAGIGTPGAAPEGFALGHYLGLAWRIVRWDDGAVREVMDDSHALPYEILIWSVSIVLPLLLILTLARFKSHALSLTQIVNFIELSLISAAIYGLVHMGICHQWQNISAQVRESLYRSFGRYCWPRLCTCCLSSQLPVHCSQQSRGWQ
jgi:hypothetical protein